MDSFDLDKFINFPLNDGDYYFDRGDYFDGNGCGCAKGCLYIALGGKLYNATVKAAAIFDFKVSDSIQKGFLDNTNTKLYPDHMARTDIRLARIADRAEAILLGLPVKNVSIDLGNRPIYTDRKVKCKEFLLRALSKFGYIKLAKGSVQQVREKANV